MRCESTRGGEPFIHECDKKAEQGAGIGVTEGNGKTFRWGFGWLSGGAIVRQAIEEGGA